MAQVPPVPDKTQDLDRGLCRLIAMQPKLLTIQDLSVQLQIHPDTVRRWTRRKRLPQPLRLGNWVRWQPKDLARWKTRIIHA